MAGAKNRITIKEVAAQAGVSIATVHLVLSDKSGPSEKTQRQVKEAAAELNYQFNSVASALKRGITRIAAILPSADDGDLFHYGSIWQGIRAYCEKSKDFSLELVEVPYVSHGSVAIPIEAVTKAMEEKKLAGLIALGDMEPQAKRALRSLSQAGTPIVLVDSDAPQVHRICCVQADHPLLGCIMGEILCGQTPRGGSILVCAGHRNTPAHQKSVAGLEHYLRTHDPGRVLYKVHHCNDMDGLYRQLADHFQRHCDIAGCCSITAPGSVALAKALSDTGMAGKIPAIGSGVFHENLENLKNGIFTNLMSQNPFQQGWHAADRLFHYVFRNQNDNQSIYKIKSEVIFQSMIPMYENSGACNHLIF